MGARNPGATMAEQATQPDLFGGKPEVRRFEQDALGFLIGFARRRAMRHGTASLGWRAA